MPNGKGIVRGAKKRGGKTYCGKSGQPPRSSEAWFCKPAKDLKVEYQCDSCREKDVTRPQISDPLGLHPQIANCGPGMQEEYDDLKDSTLSPVNSSGKATKHNAGKTQWGLLLSDFSRELHQVIEVRKLGIKKYERYNWQNDLPEDDFFTDPAIRHIISAQKGDLLDGESKMPHLAHAALTALMALWHENETLGRT